MLAFDQELSFTCLKMQVYSQAVTSPSKQQQTCPKIQNGKLFNNRQQTVAFCFFIVD